jgi:hypothetical protein
MGWKMEMPSKAMIRTEVKCENRLPLGGKAVFVLGCDIIINLLLQLIPA